MSTELETTLGELGPEQVLMDPGSESARTVVVGWAAGRGDVTIGAATDAVPAGSLLITTEPERATAAVQSGASPLYTGSQPLEGIPDGWVAETLPEGVLIRPEAAPAPELPTITPLGLRADDVSIIIPVHGAGSELKRCVAALTRNTTRPAELVIVDDASTDPEVFEVLAEIADRPAVRILRNTINLGFTASINRGLRATTGDVVLLNSDTEVGPRWLERLRAAAYRDSRTGTATAGSDNAGAFSLPIVGEANAVPLHLGVDDAARLVAQAVGDRLASTPTANGFCMFLRRAMLDDVGLMDEVAFPRGYGEENDYSLRAARKGWRHVVDPGTYVHHVREASFREEKAALAKAGRALINERYPEYTPAVRLFVGDPVMAAARSAVAEAFATRTSPRPRVLFVIHEGGGGTPVGNFELMRGLEGRYDCLLFTCDRSRIRLDRYTGGRRIPIESWDLDRPIRAMDFSREDYRAIASQVLREHAVDLVHVRHLFKHTFDLPVVASRLGIPVVLSFHDFYFSCPTVHLLDDTGTYCSGRCTAGDGTCHVPDAGLGSLPHLKHAFVHQWREEVTAMLSGIDAFVTTSEHVRSVYRDTLPATVGGPFEIIPHGRSLTQRHGLNEAAKPGGPVRVLVLANLDTHKGGDYLREIKRHAGDRLELHFLGDTPERYADLGTVHGRYRPDELEARVAEIAPAMIGLFSVVAETFSHALTEAWALGVPVVATDLGAFGERLREHGGGWLVPPDDAAVVAARILQIADDPVAYRVEAWKADLRDTPSVAEMSDSFAAVYTETIARRRSLAPVDAPPPLRLTAIVGGADGVYPGSTYVRVVQPLRHPSVSADVTTRIRYASDGVVPDDAQAVLIQRTAIPPEQLLAVLDEIEARRLPLIVDLDDNLLLRADDAVYGGHQTAIQALLEAASMVTVATPALADAFRGRTARVAVVPNAIDERLFLSGRTEPPASKPPATGAPTRLVYIGSSTHGDDLALLRPVMEELHRRHPGQYVLEVVGIQPPDLDGDRPWFERLPIPDAIKPYPRFVAWLREHRDRWQIGLAPLTDDDFNRFKSDLKWLEYSALGLPVIASDLEPYRSIEDGVTGRRVPNHPVVWAEAIIASELPRPSIEGLRTLGSHPSSALATTILEHLRLPQR